MSFKYLSDICENLFENKKEIVLDIIQKNLNTQDLFYKERIDAVCNHLLKRFNNEEKYNKTPEDIKILAHISRSIEHKYTALYVLFYENEENLPEIALIEIFCQPLFLNHEELSLPYNYYRLQLLLLH
ncbi:16568_t:CDS:1, partial [Cetraspora pellucida]